MHKAERLRVELGARSYDIIVGTGLLANAYGNIVPVLASKRTVIISDSTVAGHYAERLVQALTHHGIQCDVVTVNPGEAAKSFAVLEWLMNALLELKLDRKTTILALGGGVVGDLAGFAASILLRGVPFIQIPTTLLAQVDSSVGGKTAINAKAGKNLIGSFYQPKLVLADLDTLKTLPAREMRAGYAEIIKYGLIMDAGFYDWCLANAEAMLQFLPPLRGEGRRGGLSSAFSQPQPPSPQPSPARGEGAYSMEFLQHAVATSCRCKAEIVGADERESDRRALLNFGHTFAHALEAETGYSDKLVHGEAVAIGMVMACRLSAHMGFIGKEVEHQLTAHFRALGLPATPRDIAHDWNANGITRHFITDKKAEAGTLTFVVLDEIGHARVAKAVNPALAQEVVTSFLAEAK